LDGCRPISHRGDVISLLGQEVVEHLSNSMIVVDDHDMCLSHYVPIGRMFTTDAMLQ